MKSFSMRLLCVGFLFGELVLAQMVHVKFLVSVPKHFSGAANIYLSGDQTPLGSWAPRALSLVKENNRWVGWADVLANTPFEFKTNLGDWFHSEVYANGQERPNRLASCDSDCALEVSVENFRVHQFHSLSETAEEGIEYHFDFYADHFHNFRNLAVYLPPEYYKSSKRYPVVYALDGQNLFDIATSSYGMEWRLDETLSQAHSSGRLPPFILVGIYSTPIRAEEYLFCDQTIVESGKSKEIHGQAKEYLDFLLLKIKPFIDSRYRTLSQRENTAIVGSSFGGEFALYTSFERGDVFSRFGIISPALWWGNYCAWTLLQKPLQPIPLKLWIDMGDREGWDDNVVQFKNGVADVNEAAFRLQLKGLDLNRSLIRWIEAGAIHNEVSWGKRIERTLKFLTGGWNYLGSSSS